MAEHPSSILEAREAPDARAVQVKRATPPGLPARIASMRIAVVTNRIPDYRYPIFRQLQSNFPADYLFLLSMPVDRSCDAAQRDLPMRQSASLNWLRETRHRGLTVEKDLTPIPLSLFKDLARFKPSVILAGELGLRTAACWAIAAGLASRFVIWSEDIEASARGRPPLLTPLRSFLLRRADAVLAWGEPAEEYVHSLGVRRKRIVRCEQAVDNDYWIGKSSALDRTAMRGKLGLSGTVFLLVGRLVERKGFRNFIQAWSRAGLTSLPEVMAVIVGEGEDRQALESLLAAGNITNVRLEGARSQDALAEYYASADVFVFPSLVDVWGLVVNEALCFGLPVLGSRLTGASQQLLVDRELGELIDPTDLDGFGQRLLERHIRPSVRKPAKAHAAVRKLSFEFNVHAIGDLLRGLEASRA